jgi:hypothetical protein
LDERNGAVLIKYTPDKIEELEPNQVFVFGANKNGIHAAGAAAYAAAHFGAVNGQGNGLQGQSYGIDTMSGYKELKRRVRIFIKFAKKHPELEFLVTKIGCGIAGFPIEQVAKLFNDTNDAGNIVLPEEFVGVSAVKKRRKIKK